MRLAHMFSLMSAAALTTGALALAPQAASAQGFAMGALPQPAIAAASGGVVEKVQWRRGGWGGPGWGGPGWGGGPGWRGGPGWGPRYYGGGWGPQYGYAPAYYPGWGPYYGGYGYGLGYGAGPALATGVIIGSAMAAAPQTVYVAPQQNGNWYAYCARKYRSFDPRSGTFLGYDGRRHPCT